MGITYLRNCIIIFLATCILCIANPSTANADRLKVVATILPLYITALNVAGDGASISLLVTPGSEIHEYYLKPGDMRSVYNADIIFASGAGLDTFVTDRPGNKRIVDTSAGMDLIRDSFGTDPHVWLDPVNVKIQARNIKDALVSLDPGNKALYESNAADYSRKLDSLDAEIRNALSGLKGRHLITYHNSFSYFAKRYGFVSHSITGYEGGQARPGNLKEIYDLVKADGIRAVFAEKSLPRAHMVKLKEDLGVEICELDDLISGPMYRDLYIESMRENADEIARCIGEDE